MHTVGVIGLGIVGSAVRNGMDSTYTVETYDISKPSTCLSIADLCARTEVLFVCVPTPMTPDSGAADLKAIYNVVAQVASVATDHVVAIKSTVPPGTTDSLNAKFGSKSLSVVFQPEFLTEANASEDFIRQSHIIIGGAPAAADRIAATYELAFPKAPILRTSATVAEMIKYTANCFLMTKVLFANEMYQICGALGVQWDEIVRYAMMDSRLGTTHWRVPGPDGKFGAGGSCFPKDIRALIHRARELEVDPQLLQAVWDKNDQVRQK